MGNSTTTKGRRPPHRERPPELDRPVDVRRIVKVALFVFGVAAILVGMWILVPEEASYGGPLQDPDLPAAYDGGKRSADRPLSFGFSIPWNAADQPAILDELIPLSPTGAPTIVGSGVLPPEAPPVGASGGFPPTSVRPPPVRGYTIAPGTSALDSYQIVVGLSARTPGVHTIPGFEIRYHVGDTEYRAVVIQGVWLCVPADASPKCPGKKDIKDQQRELRESLAPLTEGPER